MTNPHGYIEKLAELTSSGDSFVAVTLVDAVGSTPQDAGSKMLVSEMGLEIGTVGGGRIEKRAIEYAQTMLGEDTTDSTSFVEWNLQTDIGMTCGGTVRLYFESINHRQWHIVVFGAGHVARALTSVLVTLDCYITCYDPRSDWLDQLPNSTNLKRIEEINLPTRVSEIPEDAFVLCMTMGHRTDRPILEEIFRQSREFAYLGVIGSRAKRNVLKRELRSVGISNELSKQFHCPIGLEIGSNQPGEIAISVAAQLISERDRIRQRG